MALSNGIETKQIHQSELGQEFVLFSNREITADIANLNPRYLLEARDLNPNKKIDLHIVTKIGIVEQRSNKIVEEKECVFIAKTLEGNYERVKKEIEKIHSYSVPCIVKISVVGNEKYFDWVKGEVRND